MIPETLLPTLREFFPALRDLPPALERALRDEARPVDLQAGATVFEEGSRCEAFLLLTEGCLRVLKASPHARELLLYRVRPGDSCTVTLSCLLGRRDYPARAVVEEHLHGAVLPRALFDRLLAETPGFREQVFGALGERLVQLMGLVEEVAFHRLDQRLATRLLRRFDRLEGRVIEVTHQALADELGSVREIVTRLLHSLEASGVVRLERGRITILDPGQLREIAAGS